MEPHGVFKEVTKQCTNKDHYQSLDLILEPDCGRRDSNPSKKPGTRMSSWNEIAEDRISSLNETAEDGFESNAGLTRSAVVTPVEHLLHRGRQQVRLAGVGPSRPVRTTERGGQMALPLSLVSRSIERPKSR